MIIGICGDSGSGKTTLAKAIENSLGDCLVFDCDRYHKWARDDKNWEKFTHLNPEANNLSQMYDDVIKLKGGYPIWSSDYCHESGTFTQPALITPTKNLIVCGLHTLSVGIAYDLKIFMDTDQNLKRHWKVNRDVKERGYSLAKVLASIKKREADYTKHILKQRKEADLIVRFFDQSLEVTINNLFTLDKITSKLQTLSIGYSLEFDGWRKVLTFKNLSVAQQLTTSSSLALYEVILVFIKDLYEQS